MSDQEQTTSDIMKRHSRSVREEILQARNEGHLSRTFVGSKMVREAGALLLKATRAWLGTQKRETGTSARACQLVKQVGVERAVALTVRLLVDRTAKGATQDLGLKKLRVAVGFELQREAEWGLFSQESPVAYAYTLNDYKKASGISKAKIHKQMLLSLAQQNAILDWDTKDRALCAAVMIDLAVRNCGIFTQGRINTGSDTKKRKFDSVVSLHPSVFEWMSKGIDAAQELRPLYLPSDEKLLPWGPDMHGGYSDRNIRPLTLMSSSEKSHLEAFQESNCPKIYDSINALQDVPWRVNQATLSLLGHCVNYGWDVPGVPGPPGAKPVRPSGEYDKTEEAWIAHSRASKAWHFTEDAFKKHAVTANQALTLGAEYSSFDRFYFPHRIDFRGRVYPVGAALQYQGRDYQRAMCEFARGQPVGTGEAWFLITGANLFGKDKLTLEERVAYVRTNSEELEKIGRDPVRHRGWVDADKPFQAAAWCAEYTKFLHQGESFISHLPIGQDGVNNGLQCFSAMLRDPIGCKATNCASSDSPQDIYKEVANYATKTLRREAIKADDPKHRRYAKRILEFCKMQGMSGLPRESCKRPAMTLAYGSTLYSCQSYLSEWYTDYCRGRNIPADQQPFPEKDAFQAMSYLGTVVWDAIGNVVVKARQAMDWLREVSDEVARHEKHVRWTTPLGLIVQQAYQRGTTKRVKLRAGGSIRLSVWEGNGQPDPRKSRNALAPNWIHSADASVAHLLVCKCIEEGVVDLRMIHDDPPQTRVGWLLS